MRVSYLQSNAKPGNVQFIELIDCRNSPSSQEEDPPMRALIPCVVTTLLLASSATFAAQPNCANATDQATLNQCANNSLKASDAKLNQTFRALQNKVSKPGKDKLQKAQRAWITWRDAQCDFNTSGTRDGSIHAMVEASCLDDLTQAQTKLLNSQLHCEEGDTACGNQ
jgi:uncharacterized protein YecT (DUF1311 family)